MLLCCYQYVISPRVSTANFACWLVLVCCNLQSLSLEFSAASPPLIRCKLVSLYSEGSFPFLHVLFRCKVACLSLAVSSSMFGMVPHPIFSTFRSFGLLSLQHVGLCIFLRHRQSSCSCADLEASLGQSVVLQTRLSLGRRESGQFPIIISFLTRQEFLGVLIGLVTNGGARLPFLACCLERPKTCLCRTRPNLCSHLLH